MLGGKCNKRKKWKKVTKNYYPKTPNQDIEIKEHPKDSIKSSENVC